MKPEVTFEDDDWGFVRMGDVEAAWAWDGGRVGLFEWFVDDRETVIKPTDPLIPLFETAVKEALGRREIQSEIAIENAQEAAIDEYRDRQKGHDNGDNTK